MLPNYLPTVMKLPLIESVDGQYAKCGAPLHASMFIQYKLDAYVINKRCKLWLSKDVNRLNNNNMT